MAEGELYAAFDAIQAATHIEDADLKRHYHGSQLVHWLNWCLRDAMKPEGLKNEAKDVQCLFKLVEYDLDVLHEDQRAELPEFLIEPAAKAAEWKAWLKLEVTALLRRMATAL